jgi:hypothetical protein
MQVTTALRQENRKRWGNKKMTAIEWYNAEPGVYRTKYHGKELEVVRSKDKTAQKRYIPRINGRDLDPCWTAKDAQKKAISLLDTGYNGHVLYAPSDPVDKMLEVPKAAEAPDPVLDIGPPDSIPTDPDPVARIRFAITGDIDLADFPDAISRIKLALDLLRESGQAADLDFLNLPKVIRL